MIRYATADDAAQILEMLVDMHAEQGLFEISILKMAQTIMQTINANCVLVADHDGRLTGTFGFAVSDTWYSDEKFLADMWLYVRPESRRSMDAVRLRNALKADARERGMKLMVGALGKKLNGSKLFSRDFTKCGELFIVRE